ncbi:MAG: DoxX family protein [Bacteroidales bacterium]|nr:DoxX family protein [Bacteroidales bacterium]
MAPSFFSTKIRGIATVVLQVAVGLWFVASAVGKLVGIDEFEIYIYSFGFLGLSVAMVLARVLIAVELTLGVMLAAGVQPRRVALLLLMITLAFSVFLCYAEWIGRTDDCHCMGVIASFSPAASLVKNAVLTVSLLLLLRLPLWRWRPCWWQWMAALLLLWATPFVVSLPDCWMFDAREEPFDHELLHTLAQPGGPLEEARLDEGRKAVALVSLGCPYCQKAMQKLRAIERRNDLPDSLFVVVMPDDNAPAAAEGIPLLEGRRFVIGGRAFVRLTYGARPIILLLDNGQPVASFHYRNIDEHEISRFLKP